MKIPYPLATVGDVKRMYQDSGHTFKGKARKVGLSFALTCTRCRRSAVITPAWYPWERDKINALPDTCKER